jgi:hypothetical protein
MPKIKNKKRKSKYEKKLERHIKYYFPDEIWENILSYISLDIIEQKPFDKYSPIKTIKSISCVIRLSRIFRYIFENDIKEKYDIDKNILWFSLYNFKETFNDSEFHKFCIYCLGFKKR